VRRSLHRYGDDPSQVAELFEAERPLGIAVVLHGGFWRDRYDRHLMDALCVDLASRGWAAWNLEYRRLGSGGGWPATCDDVAEGIERLAGRDAVAIGHSAGGHLALWAAAEGLVRGAVAQAGVADLVEAYRLGLSDRVAGELLSGGPEERPDAYAAASPAHRLPLGVPQLLVHGEDDAIVPVSMSREYARAASAAGDEVQLVALAGVGHFEHLDPASEAWAAVVRWLT
jgi:pimeloyl-ACP methyl ester carboxylesterase